ncbi:hypothetical protein GCM10010278_71880 [Streptomyces melanogenes]|nr:hypothetical protein GCM10010278_71880 [Streptomyces melanogenes]
MELAACADLPRSAVSGVAVRGEERDLLVVRVTGVLGTGRPARGWEGAAEGSGVSDVTVHLLGGAWGQCA